MAQITVFEQIGNDGKMSNLIFVASRIKTQKFLEFLKNFLTKEKAENVHNSLSFPEQIKKLTDGLDLISSELKQKIRHDYPTLIKHSSNATK